MRKLSTFERSIIDRILDCHRRGVLSNYASLIDHLLQNKDIVLDFQTRVAELHADIRFYQQNQLVSVVREISVELAITANLMRELEENGYIVTFLEAPNIGHQRYGQLIQGNEYVSYTFCDLRLIDMLLDYSFTSIIVNQSLLDFVKNGYQTSEEKANKRNLTIAVCALAISTILNLGSLIYAHYELKYAKQQLEQSTKIDNQQMDIIRGDLREIKRAIEQTKPEAQKTPGKSVRRRK